MAIRNGLTLQYFHRYTPADGSFWREVESAPRAGGVPLPN
jgi:hypothetical protein